MNKQDKKQLQKVSLYIDEALKRKIELTYSNYCEAVRSHTGLEAKPLSLSAWLTAIIRKSELIRGASL